MYKIKAIVCATLLTFTNVSVMFVPIFAQTETIEPIEPIVVEVMAQEEIVLQEPEPEIVEPTPEPVEEIIVEPDQEPVVTPIDISNDEKTMLSLIAMAEAGNQEPDGIRLVIDTVLNRVDDPQFPSTIREVLYQKNQFSSMYDGGIDKCYVRDDIYQLVCEELEHRMDYNVIYFRTGHYHKHGTPLFKVGAHYFSGN